MWTYWLDLSPPDPNDVVHQWEYTGDEIPVPGDENARMNLRLFWGNPPSDGQEVEVVVSSFVFIPQ